MNAKAILLILATAGAVMPLVAQKVHRPDTIPVTIKLDNARNNTFMVDSVLVIFDRYDLRGAGIVKKVYYPVNNMISIEEVPEGRYFIDVFCMGAKKYYFKHQGFIYKGKNKLAFKLPRAEVFIPGTYVSEDWFNMNDLANRTYRW
jgi:hypothetical protein